MLLIVGHSTIILYSVSTVENMEFLIVELHVVIHNKHVWHPKLTHYVPSQKIRGVVLRNRGQCLVLYPLSDLVNCHYNAFHITDNFC